jgi:hypothetical protein
MSQRNAVAPSRRSVAHLFRQTHCQNYLFVLWGVPKYGSITHLASENSCIAPVQRSRARHGPYPATCLGPQSTEILKASVAVSEP